MALSAREVKIACTVLQEIVPDLSQEISYYREIEPIRPGFIIGYSEKADGGFENIFTDIKDISPAQKELFDEL